MEKLEQVRTLYRDYLFQTETLQKNKKPFQGLLGFGQRLGNDPCHGEFAAALEALLPQIAEELSAEEALAILEYCIRAPEENKKNELAYWMLLAVHGKLTPLVDKLLPENAAGLLALYDKLYPRNIRLPAQKTLAKLLKIAAQ